MRKLGSLNKHQEIVKTRIGNSTGNADKTSTKTEQNGKRKRSWNMWEQNEKTTREKITVQLEEINQKVLAKEGRLKRYRQRVKQYKKKKDIPKQRKKILSTTERT